MASVQRRDFMTASAASIGALSALSYARATGRPSEKVALAVMGIGGPGGAGGRRGLTLLRAFTSLQDADIAYICDVDERLFPEALKVVAARQKRAPRVEKDIRRVLQDKSVDALVVAAPDHWHALATVWACQASKHVYVEKPVSHNIIEGRRMVEAARRHNRIVQVGTQRRSSAQCATAMELVRSGKLGKVPFARTWIAGNRPSIGHQKDGAVPRGVDYDLWLGPAAQRPFNVNRFHYKWHWFWDYGTGELGNNGIHALDLIRWILNLDAPVRVSAGGGKFFYDDDQETPDTLQVTYDFPQCSVTWEHRIWSREKPQWGAILYGERGTMVIDNRGWHIQDGIEAADKGHIDSDQPHQRNFLECIKTSRRPNADIEEGHKSTRLCHLGNIAFRTGRSLRFDARTETCHGDAEANRLLGRSYRKPFVLPDRV
jgi:predicted dehydrogenase